MDADHNDRQPATRLVVRGLTKRFGGTTALAEVNLTVAAGQVHALLGANGAGKSTLIKILAGVHAADSGEVTLRGRSIGDALAARTIAFVHQDLGLIDTMSVGENMAVLFGYPRRRALIDWRSVDVAAGAALRSLGVTLPLDIPVGQLSQAEKSIVAIARTLTGKLDILVLDEPTASLPEADVAHLFQAVQTLRARGVGIIYVTHRLDEVFRLADAVTVLRDGRNVASYLSIAELSPEQLVRDIVGRMPTARVAAVRAADPQAVLEVDGLCVGGCGPVTFQAGAGEVLGLAGLRGQGHEVIGRALGGLLAPAAGKVRIGGKPAVFANPCDAISAGVGFSSSKRIEESLAVTMTVRENLFLNPLNFGRNGWSARAQPSECADARAILRRFDVRPDNPELDITALSGGNQQKVVLARLIGRDYRVLVLEEPTMGVDIGAKADIYAILARSAADGLVCLVVSSDLDELAQICTRVLAFSRGRIVAELVRSELSVEALTHAIGGTAVAEAAPANLRVPA